MLYLLVGGLVPTVLCVFQVPIEYTALSGILTRVAVGAASIFGTRFLYCDEDYPPPTS